MPESITITLPHPPEASRPNARGGWRSKAQATKQQRTDAHLAAIDALHDWKERPRWKAATIQATFYRPESRAKQEDQDNALARLKGSCDGLQDAEVLRDDKGVIWLPPIQHLGKAANGERKLVLTVTRIE